MNLRLNLQTASALAAGLLLILAVINAVLSEAELRGLGRMTYQGDALVRLRAAVPDIDSFEFFNVNKLNPFIPFHMRGPEMEAGNRRDNGIPPPPPVRKNQAPPPPPRLPPLVYPKLNATPADAPRAVGLIGTETTTMLLVRQGAVAVPVPIGGTMNGWTLVEVAGGNQAVWDDPSGTRHTFPVGSGDLAEALPDAAGQGAGKDGGKKPGEAQVIKPKAPKKPADGQAVDRNAVKTDGKTDGKKDAKTKPTNAPRDAKDEGKATRQNKTVPETPVITK